MNPNEPFEYHHHSIPWALDEFALWRGYKLICHKFEGVTFLYLPGGRIVRASEAEGVILPFKIRPKLVTG